MLVVILLTHFTLLLLLAHTNTAHTIHHTLTLFTCALFTGTSLTFPTHSNLHALPTPLLQPSTPLPRSYACLIHPPAL